MHKYCSHETLPLFSSRDFYTSDCYFHQDLHYVMFTSALRQLIDTNTHTSLHICKQYIWLTMSKLLERYPFSGRVNSAGELLHTP